MRLLSRNPLAAIDGLTIEMDARLGSRFVPAFDCGHDFLNGCTFKPPVRAARLARVSYR